MKLTFTGIDNIPMVEPGNDLAGQIVSGLATMGETLQEDRKSVV